MKLDVWLLVLQEVLEGIDTLDGSHRGGALQGLEVLVSKAVDGRQKVVFADHVPDFQPGAAQFFADLAWGAAHGGHLHEASLAVFVETDLAHGFQERLGPGLAVDVLFGLGVELVCLKL